jgi:hypothetical protein
MREPPAAALAISSTALARVASRSIRTDAACIAAIVTDLIAEPYRVPVATSISHGPTNPSGPSYAASAVAISAHASSRS